MPLDREKLLALLKHLGVDLPPKTTISDAELDKRLDKALDSSQYIYRIMPKSSTIDLKLPKWNFNNRKLLESVRRHNLVEAALNFRAKENGVETNPLYTNAFMDLRQSLMSIANVLDQKRDVLVLEDKEGTSGISMKLLDVFEWDPKTPIIVVLFSHDLASAPSKETFAWMSDLMNSGTMKGMTKITATLDEQELKRFPSSYKPKRTPIDKHMTMSFLPPVGPLESRDLARFNTNDGCSVCGEPAKQKCSRCSSIRYCGPVCQKFDWKNHKKPCTSLQAATWQSVPFTDLGKFMTGMFAMQLNRFDMVQHGAMTMPENPKPLTADSPSPVNTHGSSPFIVKLQLDAKSVQCNGNYAYLPTTGKDQPNIRVYDRRRTLDVYILRKQECQKEFDIIANVIRSKGPQGNKTYCWAMRTGEWTMQVCVDQLCEWQQW
ncbi:hypothetical protein C8J56DRAFT_1134477 [Mycena floridula]|nr:hypothetical protein C8J56DRAFT_1134477 [Mycena floridula]